MRYLLSLIICAGLLNASGQTDAFNTTTNLANSITLDAYDLSGNKIPTGNPNNIQGSRMLNEDFEKGLIRLKNGQQFKDILLNLSLVTNELYFKKDTLVMAFVNPVEQFVLPVNEDGKEKLVFFKSGYPSIDNQTGKSFYQLLTSGPKLELLKYKYKTAKEHYTYGGPVKNEYLPGDRLYVYDLANNKIFEIATTSKSLKKSLPAYEADINNFESQSKIKLKHEEQIKSLVDYINKQL